MISFLTDYGVTDPFVGVCHAVIAEIAPSAGVLDLAHGVRLGDVRQGAVILVDALPWLACRIHLAVVDPGVGSGRRPVVIAAGDGVGQRLLVGPDNGLLQPAAEWLGGVRAVWELTNPAYRLARTSATFHGRDVFAPAAAHLANGVDPARMGAPVDPAELVALSVPRALVESGRVRAEVLQTDRYGNLQLGCEVDDLVAGGFDTGDEVQVVTALRVWPAVVTRTFSDAAPGAVLLLEDAWGRLQLAVNRASSADVLGLSAGDAIVVVSPGPAAGTGTDVPLPRSGR